MDSLSGVSRVPPLDVVGCLALCLVPASGQPSLFALAHTGAANSLDAANQAVSNGHSL